MAREVLLTVLGKIIWDGEKKRLEITSPPHFRQALQRLELGEVALTIEKQKRARSQQQLAYHWVLLGYLSDYSGHTKEELHDAIMRQKFGVTEIQIGDIKQSVRKSVANSALFPKGDMMELIETDLELCSKLGIVVPTKEELGYLPS